MLIADDPKGRGRMQVTGPIREFALDVGVVMALDGEESTFLMHLSDQQARVVLGALQYLADLNQLEREGYATFSAIRAAVESTENHPTH